jgi:antirestriction protein ArdC
MNQAAVISNTDSDARHNRRDVHQTITDQIVAAIEAGAGTFNMPWHRDIEHAMPSNFLTGKAYNGINVLALWVAAERQGFTSAYWASYKQWRRLGCQVRKGEKGSVIVFYKQSDLEVEIPGRNEREIKTVRYARSSRVFNAQQVDGFQPKEPDVRDFARVLVEAERFVGATGADIRIGGDRAYYQPSSDYIRMPDRERFTGTETISATESFYAVLMHELSHWCGHERRLNRNLSGRFGDESYAMEELVAELGAAFLCSELDISNQPRPDHAAYIAHWLSVLKQDTRAIFTAAAKANEAKTYLMGLQTGSSGTMSAQAI